MALCQVCDAPVTAGARGRKPQFCSSNCRVRSHRGQGIPVELRRLARWIRHRNKVPLTITGRPASSTNPLTWSSYADARRSVKGDGLGFVLNGDGIVCIDLDHCYDGIPTAQAQAVLDLFPDTYVEVSPSGTGLHIWGFAPLLKGRRFTLNGLSVEVYPSGRYMTVTGNAVNKASFAHLELSHILP
jgi:primase-polymerase (primpol)-like protein